MILLISNEKTGFVYNPDLSLYVILDIVKITFI
jgi:hypothetical protein